MRLSIIAILALAFWAREDLQEWLSDGDCFTDTCVFIKCSKEMGRPCTDEDVFGPHNDQEDGPCDELPMDHPDTCAT